MSPQPFPLFHLPPELRLMIYSHVAIGFRYDHARTAEDGTPTILIVQPHIEQQLLQTCSAIRNEAAPIITQLTVSPQPHRIIVNCEHFHEVASIINGMQAHPMRVEIGIWVRPEAYFDAFRGPLRRAISDIILAVRGASVGVVFDWRDRSIVLEWEGEEVLEMFGEGGVRVVEEMGRKEMLGGWGFEGVSLAP